VLETKSLVLVLGQGPSLNALTRASAFFGTLDFTCKTLQFRIMANSNGQQLNGQPHKATTHEQYGSACCTETATLIIPGWDLQCVCTGTPHHLHALVYHVSSWHRHNRKKESAMKDALAAHHKHHYR
jgi:hypothetical protein